MKISIITPVFNNVNSIATSIESVINEKKDNDIEYIVIDGMSNDGTLDVIKKYVQYIDFFISEKDVGVNDAINKGIKRATGDYIFVLAGDDYLINGAIYSFKNSVNKDIDVWCGSTIVKSNGNYYFSESFANLELLNKSCSLRHPATFFKRDVYKKYGFYDISFKIAGDWDLFVRLYKNKANFQIESIPIVVFSDGGISSCKGLVKTNLEERAIILRKIGKSDFYIKKDNICFLLNIIKVKLKLNLKKFVFYYSWIESLYRNLFRNKKQLTESDLKKLGIN